VISNIGDYAFDQVTSNMGGITDDVAHPLPGNSESDGDDASQEGYSRLYQTYGMNSPIPLKFQARDTTGKYYSVQFTLPSISSMSKCSSPTPTPTPTPTPSPVIAPGFLQIGDTGQAGPLKVTLRSARWQQQFANLLYEETIENIGTEIFRVYAYAIAPDGHEVDFKILTSWEWSPGQSLQDTRWLDDAEANFGRNTEIPLVFMCTVRNTEYQVRFMLPTINQLSGSQYATPTPIPTTVTKVFYPALGEWVRSQNNLEMINMTNVTMTSLNSGVSAPVGTTFIIANVSVVNNGTSSLVTGTDAFYLFDSSQWQYSSGQPYCDRVIQELTQGQSTSYKLCFLVPNTAAGLRILHYFQGGDAAYWVLPF
jgi:hypothetical protein